MRLQHGQPIQQQRLRALAVVQRARLRMRAVEGAEQAVAGHRKQSHANQGFQESKPTLCRAAGHVRTRTQETMTCSACEPISNVWTSLVRPTGE